MQTTPRHGFTLIELLVVIGIVLLLAGMLFPVLAKARRSSHRVTCLNNLRQLSLAFTMYANDHEEAFPATDNLYLWQGRLWRPVLTAYVGNKALFWCPADGTARHKYESTSYAYLQAFFHRPEDLVPGKANGNHTCTAPPEAQHLGDVTYPDKKILLYEWFTSHEAPLRTMWNTTGPHTAAFVDGHVALVRHETLCSSALGDRDPNWTVGGVGGKDIP